jgi:hypothetical protein
MNKEFDDNVLDFSIITSVLLLVISFLSFFPEVKPGSTSAEVKKMWTGHPLTHTSSLHSAYLDKHRDKLTFSLPYKEYSLNIGPKTNAKEGRLGAIITVFEHKLKLNSGL